MNCFVSSGDHTHSLTHSLTSFTVQHRVDCWRG